ncbi:quinone oxidoreductase family protein [Nocardioides cheoyonin]|uniref:quinone oxidoreductase family protein n=1 Tax=Nocardioides cheoyonin TaxID=3156615 RepID=UPI0032B59EC5
MRAAVLEVCGEPPVVGQRPDPSRRDGEALVAVVAAPVTPLDLLCASGTSYFGRPQTPYVPGVQGVGVVEESTRHPAGTWVWFPTVAGMAPGDGSLAELVVVPDGDLVPLESGVDPRQLAALGLSAVAAWGALVLRGGLVPGERVLVLGSSGVVGSVALQLARLHGAARTYAAARPSRHAEADAGRLGADGFVPILADDDIATLAERIGSVAGEVDLVIDPLCGLPSAAALLRLAPCGRLVNLGSSAGETAVYSSAHLRSGSRAVLGYTNNDLTEEQRADGLTEIQRRLVAGELTARSETFTLDDATTAWRRQRAGDVDGRAVIAVR